MLFQVGVADIRNRSLVRAEQIDADERIGRVLYNMVRDGKSESDLREALFSAPSRYKPFIECPVLALDGAKDLEVVADQNIRAWDRNTKPLSKPCHRSHSRWSAIGSADTWHCRNPREPLAPDKPNRL